MFRTIVWSDPPPPPRRETAEPARPTLSAPHPALPAAVPNQQGSYPRTLLAGGVGFDEPADPRAHRGDLRGWNLPAVTDYRKPPTASRFEHHRRRDSLPCQV